MKKYTPRIEQISNASNMALPYLAEIETGRKRGSVSVLKAIAAVLKLELEDVAG
jgi:transcriptional regulator with XRE-family HTH domain